MNTDDYFTLYPMMTVKEIKQRFGDFAHSESQIRRIYQNCPFGSQREAQKKFIALAMKQKPDCYKTSVFKTELAKQVRREKEEAIRRVEGRLKIRGNLWLVQ